MKTVIRSGSEKMVLAEDSKVGKTYLLKKTNSYYLRIELDKDFMKKEMWDLIPFAGCLPRV